MTETPTQTWPTLDDGRMLVLRANSDRYPNDYNDFRWPLEVGATAVAPDWNPDPALSCGGGLHGLLWGCGSASLLHAADDPETTWLVVAVDPADIATPIDTGVPEKVRFRACEIMHVGTDRAKAVEFLAAAVPDGVNLPFVYGTSTSGYGGTSTSGDGGTSTSGDRGTSTSGDGGTSTSGDRGTSTSGDGGTSTSGDGGTSTSGDRGTSTSGDGGVLIITFYDQAQRRYRQRATEVDGETIKANTPYRLNEIGEFIEVVD